MTVSAQLAQVSVPTPVMHSRDDARVPFDQGGQLAAGIAGRGSCPCRATAFPKFLQEIRAFLAT
jgi:hypothetical protein